MSESAVTPRISSRFKRKWAVVLLGMLIFAFGLREIWHPLMLACTGRSGIAELVQVVKERTGEPAITIRSVVDLPAQLEPRDRAWTFWCDFRLATVDGREAMIRLPVGGKHKPTVPFTEPDGSPYTLTVRYDPLNPADATFPTVLGVWFLPVIILYTGFIAILAGAILLRSEIKDPPVPAGQPPVTA